MLYFFVHWVEKYSTGWWPPIGGGRSEMGLPKPNLTNFDVFFFAKSTCQYGFGEMLFFCGPQFHFLWPWEVHFSECQEVFRNWGAPLNFGKPSHMMIVRKVDYKRSSVLQIILKCTFPKLRGAPQFWKIASWGRPSILENHLTWWSSENLITKDHPYYK